VVTAAAPSGGGRRPRQPGCNFFQVSCRAFSDRLRGVGARGRGGRQLGSAGSAVTGPARGIVTVTVERRRVRRPAAAAAAAAAATVTTLAIDVTRDSGINLVTHWQPKVGPGLPRRRPQSRRGGAAGRLRAESP
jgi:hypothetical protein